MYFLLIKHLGLRWLAQRFWFKIQKNLGLLEKRMPIQSWANYSNNDISSSAKLWREKLHIYQLV
jgi:hypothetical protein